MDLVRLGDATIRFDDQGRGHPILLLHGFPTTRLLWKQVAPLLVEAGFRVVAPDLVGYGESLCPPELEPDMASQAGWMLALLDTLGIRRTAVVAHDVGTAAAQILVARAPERAAALVLVDGVHGAEWAMGAIAPILAWAEPARLFRVLVRQLRTSGPVRLEEEVVREVLAPYQGEAGGAKLIRAARALHPQQTVEIMPALRARRVPARVLWGEHDAYFPVDAVGRPLAELLDARLMVLPGGHFLPLDCPREVADAVAGFVAHLR
ncbi:MAG TPA: alpha/beta hydrolase [Anaeromyxobacteraceae bacterium]|nr:alpha/beta hydrolase [Anaeromyxobacteraceae bacterium]